MALPRRPLRRLPPCRLLLRPLRLQRQPWRYVHQNSSANTGVPIIAALSPPPG